MEENYKEKSRIAINGPEHTMLIADNNLLHPKRIQLLVKSQKIWKTGTSPKKQKLRKVSGKYIVVFDL